MNIPQAMSLSEQDLITSILQNFFIVDYGYINKVNADRTVNVTHAAKSVLLDGTELQETTSDNVEVLTISGAGFSIQWDYKAKDRVLLLGLKDYIPKVEDVEKAEVPKAFMHYSRSTLKAIPMCIFSDRADVKIKAEGGNLTIECKGNCTVKSQHTKLEGGMVEIGGTVAPTGTGALCGLPYCAFSGAPHSGNISTGA